MLFLCILLSTACYLSTLAAQSNHSLQIAKARRYQAGDQVQSYRLLQRIDTLGLARPYELQYHWTSPGFWPLIVASDLNTTTESESLIPKRSDKCFGSYCLDNNIFHGGHGDVWRAHRMPNQKKLHTDEAYILKRMRVTGRAHILRCAKREIYFGEMLKGMHAYPRYVTYFIDNDNYWLVFRDEGTSLQSLLYAADGADDSRSSVLKPSSIWYKMRTTKAGIISMKGIMHQIISNVAELHRLHVLHRDIKPSNILLNAEDTPRVLLADFSSAVVLNSTNYRELYGSIGPSIDESTLLYAPPEVLLAVPANYYTASTTEASLPFDPTRPESYDIWSIGVLFLELLLGTADVFNVDQRTAAMVAQKLRRRVSGHTSEQAHLDLLRKGLFMASLADYCIYRRPLLSEDTNEQQDVLHQRTAKRKRNRDQAHYSDKLSSLSYDLMSVAFANGANSAAVSQEASSHPDEAPFQVLLGSHNHRATPLVKSLPSLDSDHIYSNRDIANLPTCSQHDFSQAILRRDPLGKGFHDKWGVDLLYKLLAFDPIKRINLSEALGHAYFRGVYLSLYDRSEHATARERDLYDQNLIQHVDTPYFASSSTKGSLQRVTIDSIVDKQVVLLDDGQQEAKRDQQMEEVWMASEQMVLATPVNQDEHTSLNSMSCPYPLHIFSAEEKEKDPIEASIFEHFDEDEDQVSITNVDEVINNILFTCPKCKRSFLGDWQACTRHMKSRNHGLHCLYALPSANADTVAADDIPQGAVTVKRDVQKKNSAMEIVLSTVDANMVVLDEILPPCLSDHALLPLDPISGWCDLQGRRMYVEDMHVLYHGDGYMFTGVFDGHFGSYAARYSAKHIYSNFFSLLSSYMQNMFKHHSESSVGKDDQLKILQNANAALISRVGSDWIAGLLVHKSDPAVCLSYCSQPNMLHLDPQHLYSSAECVRMIPISMCNEVNSSHLQLSAATLLASMRESYLQTNTQLLAEQHHIEVTKQLKQLYIGGSTATIAILLPDRRMLVASVGDSRIIACCHLNIQHPQVTPSAIQLSVDHTPYNADEHARVIERGAFVAGGSHGSLLRVNGRLAVTRSLGDPDLAHVLSAEPDVILLQLPAIVARIDNQESAADQPISANTPCGEYFILQMQTHRSIVDDRMNSRVWLSFAVIGSDGLWDVMSNDEATQLVCADLLLMMLVTNGDISYPLDTFQRISRHLAHEAFLRGSSDNIGVSVIDLALRH